MAAARQILVIGKSGQVASALDRLNGASSFAYRCAGRDEADLTDPNSLAATIEAARPDLVINAAAYTAVDKAEEEPDLAHAVNAVGPAELAVLCQKHKLPLIHISTDYVFDGAGRKPYSVDHPINPLGVYGASKAAGEAGVRQRLERHFIFRTAWVYDEAGRNFLNTMLRLGAERPLLRVVDDQIGSPTYAGDIAAALDMVAQAILDNDGARLAGTYHLTNGGATSWHGFAAEIFAIAAGQGGKVPRLEAITTADYPTPARRPAYSVLDMTLSEQMFSLRMAPWQDALQRCMAAKPASV